MKAYICYSHDYLAEMDLDYPMNMALEAIQIGVSRSHGPLPGVPVAALDGSRIAREVWEYRLDGYLPCDPKVPCYRFARVLP